MEENDYVVKDNDLNKLQVGAVAPDHIIAFHDTSVINGPRIGRLYMNEDGKLAFEGDVEESARIFFDAVIKNNVQHECKCKGKCSHN